MNARKLVLVDIAVWTAAAGLSLIDGVPDLLRVIAFGGFVFAWILAAEVYFPRDEG